MHKKRECVMEPYFLINLCAILCFREKKLMLVMVEGNINLIDYDKQVPVVST